jgi:hypothetical protein
MHVRFDGTARAEFDSAFAVDSTDDFSVDAHSAFTLKVAVDDDFWADVCLCHQGAFQ